MIRKIKIVFPLLAVLLISFSSCKDDVVSAGASVLESEDSIIVRSDTFSLTSALVRGGAVTATPDSFMIGELDSKYGHLHADLLTQLACPIGFRFPEGAELDSVCLFLYYRNAYGDGNAPLAINAYAMDRATFAYNEPLRSDTAIDVFCSMDIRGSFSQVSMTNGCVLQSSACSSTTPPRAALMMSAPCLQRARKSVSQR